MQKIVLFILLILLVPTALAIKPIARWDVVPHQRINQGESFNIGVVAFHRHGIEKVEFYINGQGYSGDSPKIATEMILNPRTNVWEYWVPLSADEFTSDGPITIEAVVYGNDGDTRDKDTDPGEGLDPLTLLANPLNTLEKNTAWVSESGDDATAELENPNAPFSTIGAAAIALQTQRAQNGNDNLDGSVIRLHPGSYIIERENFNYQTENEWLTITNAPQFDGNPQNTIINGMPRPFAHQIPVSILRIENITLRTTAEFQYVLSGDETRGYWINNAILTAVDRYAPSGDEGRMTPIKAVLGWYTNTLIHEVDFASTIDFNRNLTIENISSDAFRGGLILNSRLHDIDPDDLGYHADVWQFFGAPKKNRIMFGLYATDVHYQGLFMRHDTNLGESQRDIAFVNNVVEMRSPFRSDGGLNICSDENICVKSSLHNRWDHVIMWHNTFLGHATHIGANRDGTSMWFNASVIGNIFTNMIAAGPGYWSEGQVEQAWTLPDNTHNNEFIHNHYYNATVDYPECWGQVDGIPSCSDVLSRSNSPDTEPNGEITQSLGPNVVVRDETQGITAMPLENTVILDRINPTVFQTVPIDVFGNPRNNLHDVGAVEFQNDNEEPPQECLNDFDNNPCDGSINIAEVLDAVTAWKNNELNLQSLLTILSLWKNG